MFVMWRYLVMGFFSMICFSSVTYAQDAQIEFVLKKLEGGVYNLYDTTIYCDFIRGASPGIDGFDAPKADQFNENLSIYRNGRDWFTETRPLVNCNDTIQLRLYKMKTASYQLKVDMSLFLAQSGLTAILQDAQLNTERVLNFGQIALINFSNSVTSSFRFRIVFRRTLVETAPFTQLPAVCRGQLINLSTTSTNNITGSWTPAVNNTQTTTYTFIPSEGQCATNPNMTVQVNQPINPTFNEIGPFTTGSNFTLPSTSNNGIPGNWSPAINNTQTTTYTFTPDAGQCANTAQITVVINFPTSVLDWNADKFFKIYPNPVSKSGAVQLAFQNKVAGLYRVSLLNVAGARIKHTVVSHSGGSAAHSINLDNRIRSGMYLMEIVNEKGDKERLKMVVE
jgi:hypothetical protein